MLTEIDDNLLTVNNDLLHIKDNIIKKLLDEISMLRLKLNKLENDVPTNFKNRENNIEICGIPSVVTDKNLEGTVINILSVINCPVERKDIQACHSILNLWIKRQCQIR